MTNSKAPSPQHRSIAGLARLLPWLLIGLGVIVVVAAYPAYGPTPDEGVQATYGELALKYFASGGADRSCNEFIDLRFYGPLVEMIPALIYDPAAPGKYEIRHLFLGLLSLLVIPAAWLYGRAFRIPGLPLLAVLAIVTLPRLFGHWFNNSKDMPFALAMLWFMVTLAWLIRDPTWRWRQMIACGLAMGLTLCVRPGGFPILGLFLGTAVLISVAGSWANGLHGDAWLKRPASVPAESTRVPGGAITLQRLARVAVVPLIAWVLMILPWPWAHQAPLANPIEAMRTATRFPTTMPVLFGGVTWQSDDLPWYYIAKYLLIGTPLGTLLLALAGLLIGLRVIVRERTSTRAQLMALTLVWLFVPLLIFALLRPNVYGGMRHFLFLWPAVGILAGYGAAGIWNAVREGRRSVVGLALLAILLLPVRDLVRLHPYQTAYYNALVGGVEGASAGYWTDYSMSSYKEAIEWVNEQAALDPERRVRVVIAAGVYVMIWAVDYAAANVDLVPLSSLPPEERRFGMADYFVGTTRLDTDRTFPRAPIVHTIGRDGAVFTVIRRLSEPGVPVS